MVRGSVRAVRAGTITRVSLMETSCVADARIVGVCARIRSGADRDAGDDYHANSEDGYGDGASDGDHCTSST